MLSADPPNEKGTNVRPSSMCTNAVIMAPRFAPPYSSGVLIPQKPSSLAFNCRSFNCSRVMPGLPSRSLRRTCGSSGISSFRTNSRTVRCTIFCSGVKVKSTDVTPFML